MRRLLAYLLLLALLACSSFEEKGGGRMDPSLEGKPVTVTFSVPDVRIAVPTRGLDEGDGAINGAPYLDPDKMYLVVCGHSQSIKYIRKAELVVDEVTGQPVTSQVPVSQIPGYPLTGGVTTVDMYSFRVQLELSDSDRTVHILGNVDENQLITGSYSYQLLPAMMSYEGRQAYWQKINLDFIHPLLDANNQPVMVNGSYLPDAETEASLSCIPLIRNYSKIQVRNTTAPEDGFELYSYAVIHFPRRGAVVPYRNGVSPSDDPFSFKAAPSAYRFSGYENCDFSLLEETLNYEGHLPASVEFDHEIPTESEFENPDGMRVIRYDPNDAEQGFYIYERCVPNADLEPTFIILRGKFGDDAEYYYYRLDLMETKNSGAEAVVQYYPIFRNFRYTVSLNRVSSVGVSTPELASVSSGAEDISADISMRHLSDISNGQTRLVVEPFMAKTYTGPNEEGYYYLYARFFNDLNSPDPNVEWGAVSVELEPMDDLSEDILVLYDDVGNEVHGFYPSSQVLGGEAGFRVIRFNTKAPGNETKTQKIKITGRNLYAHEDHPLYREVEISLQRKQPLTVTCVTKELPLQKSAKQEVRISVPAGLPESMFPLEFILEAELPTLTPDPDVPNNNLPVSSGLSISDNVAYAGKNTIQFVRTLTREEYESLPVTDGQSTFSSYFVSNRAQSATTVWASNEYFTKGCDTFSNLAELSGHFYVQADDDEVDGCYVQINYGNSMQYNLDETGWQDYKANTPILLERNHKVAFRSTATLNSWNGGNRFYCYNVNSQKEARDGKFSLGGNIASLIMGDNYASDAESYTGSFSFSDLFKNHVNLSDAYNLVIPMKTCQGSCYKSMFDGCRSLKRGPETLPATQMAQTCCRNMFLNCSSLTYAPYLAATKIEKQCYQRMFEGCTSLKLIRMNGANYDSGSFTDWVKGLQPGGEIWLNPAIRTSKNFENIIPQSGTSWRWTLKTLPDGDPWTY